MTDRDDLTLPDTAVVSPSTGLDSELRAFMGRLMTGYEAAHRRVADLCDTMAARAEKAEGATARALELQIRLAEEREELISRRHQRELEADAARQRQNAFSDVTRDVRSLLPLIGKKLLGAPLTGDDSHGLQDLLTTMSADQIASVIETGTLQLSQAQRQLLGATLASLASTERGAAE
jgi:hypothetical protein